MVDNHAFYCYLLPSFSIMEVLISPYQLQRGVMCPFWDREYISLITHSNSYSLFCHLQWCFHCNNVFFFIYARTNILQKKKNYAYKIFHLFTDKLLFLFVCIFNHIFTSLLWQVLELFWLTHHWPSILTKPCSSSLFCEASFVV